MVCENKLSECPELAESSERANSLSQEFIKTSPGASLMHCNFFMTVTAWSFLIAFSHRSSTGAETTLNPFLCHIFFFHDMGVRGHQQSCIRLCVFVLIGSEFFSSFGPKSRWLYCLGWKVLLMKRGINCKDKIKWRIWNRYIHVLC